MRLLVGQFLWQGLSPPDADEISSQLEEMKAGGREGKDLITEAILELSEDYPAFTAVLDLSRQAAMCMFKAQFRGHAFTRPEVKV